MSVHDEPEYAPKKSLIRSIYIFPMSQHLSHCKQLAMKKQKPRKKLNGNATI
jgi:hypothetical protein